MTVKPMEIVVVRMVISSKRGRRLWHIVAINYKDITVYCCNTPLPPSSLCILQDCTFSLFIIGHVLGFP